MGEGGSWVFERGEVAVGSRGEGGVEEWRGDGYSWVGGVGR